jgi:hypothetical protein
MWFKKRLYMYFPDSSEEELGPDMEYILESYGRVEQRRRRLARATSHGDGGASA